MKCHVVLLPGMDGTGDLFAPLLNLLRPGLDATVVSYPDEPLGYAALEEIVAEALPRNGRFIVVAESFSGPIAVSIASTSPPGLSGCILCASFVRSPRRLAATLAMLLGLFPQVWIPDAIAAYYLLGRFATFELRQMYSAALARVSPGTLRARLDAIATVDVSDRLKALRVPSLYLRATEDRVVPGSAAALYSKLAAHGRILDVEAPHFLLQANPKDALQLINEFASEVE